MRNFLMIDDVNTKEFGMQLIDANIHDFPQRDVSLVQVPGRSGDLVLDNGRWVNIDITYKFAVEGNSIKRMDEFRAFLLSGTGYRRLQSTFEPDYYRSGVFVSPSSPQLSRWGLGGAVEVTFNCKPQRFLKAGEEMRTYAAGDVIHNPTRYPSKPLIRVYGNGKFSVGDQTVKVENNSTYLDIDCELQDAFHGYTNMNRYITLLSGAFPTIGVGNTGIAIDGVSKLEIETRFWTI